MKNEIISNIINKNQDEFIKKIALKIASHYHSGQVDKNNEPYIYHPIRVARKCNTTPEKIVAILHDTIEDTELKLEDLTKIFSEDIIKALDCITHRKNEPREDYYKRVKSNSIAHSVKLYDIEDNILRLPLIKDIETKTRLQKKYEKALDILNGEIK